MAAGRAPGRRAPGGCRPRPGTAGPGWLQAAPRAGGPRVADRPPPGREAPTDTGRAPGREAPTPRAGPRPRHQGHGPERVRDRTRAARAQNKKGPGLK